ncbi:MAG: hypothetical protein K940chlam2_01242 [Chlamydiae bacterium]|nr:hypothetical protein [Chlamydiota bacterium]
MLETLVNHGWNALCSISFVDWIDEAARDLLDVRTHRLGSDIHEYGRILSEGGLKTHLLEREIFHATPGLRYFLAPRLQAIHKSLDAADVNEASTLLKTAEGCGLGFATPITKVTIIEGDETVITPDRLGITGLFKAGVSMNLIDRIKANLQPFLLKLAKLVALIALPILLFLFSFPLKGVFLVWVGIEMALATARFALPLILEKHPLPLAV